ALNSFDSRICFGSQFYFSLVNSVLDLMKHVKSTEANKPQSSPQKKEPGDFSQEVKSEERIDWSDLVRVFPVVELEEGTPVAELIRIIAFLTVFHASIEIDCYCSFFRHIESTNYTILQCFSLSQVK
ncbi:unnamed protein product, partial [Vitis vinifera]